MKRLLLLLLLIIPSVLATEQTFTSPIVINTTYDNSTNNQTRIDIVIEDFTKQFYCTSSNSSNSYTVNIKKNVSQNIDLSGAFTNLTQNVNGLAATCDKITQQYGDINKYFSLYATCNTDNELCKIAKTAAEQRVTDLTPFKTNYESCNTNLANTQKENQKLNSEVIPSIQGNLTSCNSNLKSAQSYHLIWGIVGALIVAALWTIERKKMNPGTSKDRTAGLGGRVG